MAGASVISTREAHYHFTSNRRLPAIRPSLSVSLPGRFAWQLDGHSHRQKPRILRPRRISLAVGWPFSSTKTKDPKASADYGKRASSEVEFSFTCVSNYGGGCREGGGGVPIFSADLALNLLIKVCKN